MTIVLSINTILQDKTNSSSFTNSYTWSTLENNACWQNRRHQLIFAPYRFQRNVKCFFDILKPCLACIAQHFWHKHLWTQSVGLDTVVETPESHSAQIQFCTYTRRKHHTLHHRVWLCRQLFHLSRLFQNPSLVIFFTPVPIFAHFGLSFMHKALYCPNEVEEGRCFLFLLQVASDISKLPILNLIFRFNVSAEAALIVLCR